MISIRSITDPDWLGLVNQHAAAMIFHHPAWADLLASCYGYRASAILFEDDSGRVMGGVPAMRTHSWLTGRRMISLPFSDFCQPLFYNETEDERLLGELIRWQQQNAADGLIIHWPLPERPGIKPGQMFYQHTTRLCPDPALVMAAFDRKVGQFIRQAERAKITVRQSNQWEDMDLFYRLQVLTRRRLGVPVQPRRYFRLLWEKIINPGLGMVLLAYQDTRPIAGGVFLCWNKTLTAKYAASDPAYWGLRPNHLIFWAAMQWGCTHDCHSFDWGRTDLDEVGLKNFKRGWASQERIAHYSILGKESALPQRLATYGRWAMKTVIQHGPIWVGKMLGEALYGHFA